MRHLIARRFVIILCAALERTGLGKGEARRFAAEAVAIQGNAFPDAPSAEAIHRWQRNQPPLTAADEGWITTAFSLCGNDRERLAQYFTGIIHLRTSPLST